MGNVAPTAPTQAQDCSADRTCRIPFSGVLPHRSKPLLRQFLMTILSWLDARRLSGKLDGGARGRIEWPESRASSDWTSLASVVPPKIRLKPGLVPAFVWGIRPTEVVAGQERFDASVEIEPGRRVLASGVGEPLPAKRSPRTRVGCLAVFARGGTRNRRTLRHRTPFEC